MILALETSTQRASLCLFDKGKVVWDANFETERSHNSRIFTPLREALDFCDRKLDLIAVGIGPGSYSGVRVGIAAANGLSLALDVPVVGVSSLEAYNPGEFNYRVVGDARRKSFFIASIESGRLAAEPELMDEEAFLVRLSEDESIAVYTMEEKVAEQFGQAELRYPTAQGIALRAADQFAGTIGQPLKPIEPHYLRPPYITKAKKKPVPGFK